MKVSFHLAQSFSGHSSYWAYLYRMKKTRGPVCWYCSKVWDDVYHTLFVCLHFGAMIAEVERLMGRPITPEYVSVVLCGEPRAKLLSIHTLGQNIREREAILRTAFLTMVEQIVRYKEEDGSQGDNG